MFHNTHLFSYQGIKRLYLMISYRQIFNPRYSQLRHGRLLTLDTDYRGLNQFISHEDPNFRTLLMVLRQAYDHAFRYSEHSYDGMYTILHILTKWSLGLLLEKIPPSPTIPMFDETVPVNNTITVHDLLTIATLGLPSTDMNMLTTACFYGIEELVASWLARDMNEAGGYFTSRVPKLALYGAFVHVPLRDTLKWLLCVCFYGNTSLIACVLQIFILNFLVCNTSST